MSTLTALLVGIVAITGLARLHHSNKLFWTFLVSMLLGFAGAGSIRYASTYFNKKKCDATYVVPMQGSATLTVIDSALLPDTIATSHKSNLVSYAKPVGQYNVSRDIAITNRTGTSFNPETDIGITEPVNTS